MSAMVQPSADLCFLNKLINFSSCSTLSLEERITGKVSPGPKNACFNPSGSGDNSTFGVSKADGFGFSLSLGSSSKHGYQNLFCLSCVSSKIAGTLQTLSGYCKDSKSKSLKRYFKELESSLICASSDMSESII